MTKSGLHSPALLRSAEGGANSPSSARAPLRCAGGGGRETEIRVAAPSEGLSGLLNPLDLGDDPSPMVYRLHPSKLPDVVHCALRHV
jgi:hypothetical protein